MSTAGTKPVFSDFSHLGTKVEDLTFAVCLRSDENEEEMIARILPMSRITPGKIVERVIRQVVTEEETCLRPDCIARKEKLNELNSENDELKKNLKDSKERVLFTKNKISILEKSLIISEEKNDQLKADIDNTQIKLFQIDADLEKGENENKMLEAKLNAILAEIEDAKSQIDDYEENIAKIDPVASGNKQMVFSRKPLNSLESKRYALEVNNLKNTFDEDSDDD